MVHDKWFWSDHHLLHANILKFVDDQGHRLRPFDSLQEMHELFIQNNNAVVKDNDYVYWGGDVTLQYNGWFNNIMARMKGKKRLIIGNHDKVWNPSLMKWFEKAELWKGFKEYNFTLSHIPQRLESLRDGKFNVHGHTHKHKLEDPHYINICVEVREWAPVHLDTILAEIKEVGDD